MISPFVLELETRRALGVGWEDFLLGFGIAMFSLCRIVSRTAAELWDFVVMALGLTTLLNPLVFHYFKVETVAWNNIVVGGVVFILAFYEERKDSGSSRTIESHPN